MNAMKNYLKKAQLLGIKKSRMIVGILLLLAGFICEGAAIIIFIPIVNGILHGGIFQRVLTAPILGDVLTSLVGESDTRLFLVLVAFMTVMICLKMIARYYSEKLFIESFVSSEYVLRKKLFKIYLDLSKSQFESIPIEKLRYMLSSLDQIKAFYFPVISILALLISGLIYTAILLLISWELLLIALVIVVLFYFPSKILDCTLYAKAQGMITRCGEISHQANA
ncbi:hypothetical protein IID04_03010, partial [PVC group bacterium]|nr:hypothetical protein [PVC group bacterium]